MDIKGIEDKSYPILLFLYTEKNYQNEKWRSYLSQPNRGNWYII